METELLAEMKRGDKSHAAEDELDDAERFELLERDRVMEEVGESELCSNHRSVPLLTTMHLLCGL